MAEGVKLLALGLKTNSFAFGFNEDFLAMEAVADGVAAEADAVDSGGELDPVATDGVGGELAESDRSNLGLTLATGI